METQAPGTPGSGSIPTPGPTIEDGWTREYAMNFVPLVGAQPTAVWHDEAGSMSAEDMENIRRRLNLPEEPTPESTDAARYVVAEGPKVELSEETKFYLNQLCSMTGKQYDSLDLSKFAGMSEKKEINKIFFSLMPTEPTSSLHGAQVTSLTEFINSLPQNRNHRERIENMRRDIRTLHNRINDCTAELVELKKQEILFKSQGALPFVDMVKQIEAAGHWKLEAVSRTDGTLVFHQRNDTVIKWKDDTKSVDIEVNLGKFQVKVDFRRSKALVFALSGNTQADGHIHPHVASDANVCWGNASETVSTAFATFNIKQLMHTLHILLHEYNDESPYRDLTEFKEMKGYENAGTHWIWMYYLNHEDYDVSYLNMSSDERQDEDGNGALCCKYRLYQKLGASGFYMRTNEGMRAVKDEWFVDGGEFPPEYE